MIRKLFILALFIIFSQSSIAQPQAGQVEVSASIGLVSGMYIGDIISYDPDVSTREDMSESLNYLVSGKYFFSNRVALGLTLGVQTLHGNSNYEVVPNYYTYKKVDMTFAPEITFVYVTRRWFQFYSLYGIGIVPYTEDLVYFGGKPGRDGGVSVTKQLTPIAFRVGGQVAAYVEFGLGYKGLMNTGVAYSFGRARNNKRVR